ncbi:hypothetical protein KAFR_0B00990 [Kazachstania africana CBS 2517]|uniref:Autophagy-related protein 9 n=1 Tax=Kazachstania africana (strain ATCC 22294 / BCRC 22015 / CBS 2517 / CECT 1963 / NBRC 1671 / NRRL Y-8276) TaxID=1071382 RepID=H2APU7_KAZAF|nr:hypothetical protein KAFR_0B00990 [Kazachstania africana CBS 2517]CCF56397.1 hypothetical protein KAFR_0B00990 [Kazachstania africana CBS 2517]
MDRSEAFSSSHNGKNTFLSRIFGLQSDDVSGLMHGDEMNEYPIGVRSAGTGMTKVPSVNIEDELENDRESGRDGEGLRVPESDQDSTSDDDNKNNTIDYELNSQNIGLDNINLRESIDSLPKLGQLSSDEERAYEDDDASDKDALLFSKTTTGESKRKQKHPVLLQRILDNKKKKEPRRLFTPSQNTENIRSKSDSQSFLERKSTDPQLRGSFLFSGKERGSKYPFKRPNLLRNISVLNNTPAHRINTLSPKERALWKWANVENLDIFLQDVYQYYLGNGFSSILLKKVLNLLTFIFVVHISSYMGYCIDYSKLAESHRLSDIVIDKCYSNRITGFVRVLLWIFYVFIFLKTSQLYFDYKKLSELRNFYYHLLNISDNELQTIPWQNVIQQIMYLKDQNALTANVVEVKAKNRIDAHDVANRIMRKENYLIALYNNDILNLSLPIPLFRTSTLTKTLEWNINLCIVGYAFNESGFIKQSFLKPQQREHVREELEKRFMLAGFLNIILSPFLVTYFVLLYFFRYFNEYKTSPGSIGVRQYTPIAEWKFREYNELYHIFEKRVGLSTDIANKYINQFPKDKFNTAMKFIAFISGSFVAILALLAIFDPENFLNFEITQDRTVLFYITLFGTIWTVSQSSVGTEYNVFDPEESIMELSSYTHYLPSEWKGKYHTEEVKNEFCKLYNLKIIILMKELTSLVLTPFILWFSLPKSAGDIVDFFRDTSIYIDGLGYVCKYAMFDITQDNTEQKRSSLNKDKSFAGPIQNRQNSKATLSNDTLETGYDDNDDDEDEDENNMAVNKMIQSYMYFIDNYENSENMVGKYQLPARRPSETTNINPILSNKYSWKKQFRPGQRPELYSVANKPRRSSNETKRNDFGSDTNRRAFSTDKYISSSFINSNSLEVGRANEDSMQTSKGGVLTLVKQYYKQSDVGR